LSPLSSTACHSDKQDQAVEAVWTHRSLLSRGGPRTRSQRWHRRTAKGLETPSRPSSTNLATHRRAWTSDNKTSGCGRPGTRTRPSSLATSGRDGYAAAGACPMMMVMMMMMETCELTLKIYRCVKFARDV